MGGNRKHAAVRWLPYLLVAFAAIAVVAALWARAWGRPDLLILINDDQKRGRDLEQALADRAENWPSGVQARLARSDLAFALIPRYRGRRGHDTLILWLPEGQAAWQSLLVGTPRQLFWRDMPLIIPAPPCPSTVELDVASLADAISAWTHVQTGQDALAQQALDPTGVDHLSPLYLGTLDLAMGDLAAAQDRLSVAAKRAPFCYAAHYNLALAHALSCPDRKSQGQAQAERAQTLEPYYRASLELQGDVRRLSGNLQAAAIAYEQAAADQPDTLRLHVKLGQMAYELNDLESAERAFRHVIERGQEQLATDGTPILLRQMGVAAGYLGLEQAEPWLLEAFQREPSALIAQDLGDWYGQQDRLAEALEWYERALALGPNDAFVHVALGDLQQRLGELDAAQAAYARAVALSPCYLTAQIALGQTSFALGDYKQAVAAFEQAAALDPADPSAQCALGMACYLQQELEQALVAFERAVALDDTALDAYLGLGNIRLQQQRYDLAVAAYEQAARLAPDMVQAWSGLGDAYRGQGLLSEAAQAYSRAVDLAPEQAEGYLALALVLDQQGLVEEAIVTYEQALALADTALGHASLGGLYQRQGNLDAAAREYEAALERAPHTVDYQLGLALIYIAQDRPREALTLADATLVTQPTHGLAHFLRGLALEKTQDPEAAITAYRLAAQHSIDNKSLRENAEAQLRRLGVEPAHNEPQKGE